MSIREIARTLYQLKRRVEELERALEAEPPGERRDTVERELAKARAEYGRAKKILDGEKDELPSGRRR
jgi:aminoglycoside phosphotransferase (APT) family kinase protein